MTLTFEERGCAEQLARFFPKLPHVRVSARASLERPGSSKLQESTVVEFGTPEFAIFVSTLPLEFDDRVWIVRKGGRQAAEATVIALQYHEGSKAVAVRFVDGPCDWMKQP